MTSHPPETDQPRPRPLWRLLGAAVATIFVFGPPVAGLLGVREKPIENRPLAAAPSLSDGWDAFDEITPWAVDRLPGRAEAVELKARMDYYGYGDLPGTQVAQPPAVAGAAGAAARSGGGDALTPLVVRGRDGYLFLGQEFTLACDESDRFAESLDELAAFARTIEDSGRKVVFTVAPNKSSVITSALPRAVPRGSCAKAGIEAENQVLDRFRDPLWVPLREPLAALDRTGQDAYWRTDTHWTTLGSSLWSQAIVEAVGPKPGSPPTFERTTETKVPDLTRLIGLQVPETADAAEVADGPTVRETKPPGYDPAKRIRQTATWTSSPAAGLIGGKSLLVGDSFTFFGLSTFRPLFADGAFTWIGSTPDQEIARRIAESDTVVIEVVQRAVVGSLLTNKKFQAEVARQIAAADR